MNKTILVNFIRIFISLIFPASAITKISDIYHFSKIISNFNMLPDVFGNFIAITVPWIEFVSGLLLLFNFYPKENSLITIFLLVIFLVAITYALLKNLQISCGCFWNIFYQNANIFKLVENLILIGLCFVIYNHAPINTKSKRSQ